MARVLVACEYSGRVRNAFAALEHDAWSCDLLESETPGQHYQGDVRDMLAQQWDLMVCHPPCTHAGRYVFFDSLEWMGPLVLPNAEVKGDTT